MVSSWQASQQQTNIIMPEREEEIGIIVLVSRHCGEEMVGELVLHASKPVLGDWVGAHDVDCSRELSLAVASGLATHNHLLRLVRLWGCEWVGCTEVDHKYE